MPGALSLAFRRLRSRACKRISCYLCLQRRNQSRCWHMLDIAGGGGAWREHRGRPRPADAARRRLQGDHRATAAGRPALLRRYRQGGRTVRGRRAAAGAAPDGHRRHADRGRHRPADSSVHAAGHDRDQVRGRPGEGSADKLPTLDGVDYVVITAGSFDLLAEVVCEDDDHLLELLNNGSAPSPVSPSTETFVYLKLRSRPTHWGTR